MHFIVGESTAGERGDAEHRRIALSDHFSLDPLGLPVSRQIDVATREERDVFEDLLRCRKGRYFGYDQTDSPTVPGLSRSGTVRCTSISRSGSSCRRR